MKFIAAVLTFIFSICAIIWLMINMAGAGMPAHPLDLEKPRIEYVMKINDENEDPEDMVNLVDYADYFEQNPENDKDF